jgi:dihydrofolate reductase
METILVMDGNNKLSKNGIIPWNTTKDLKILYKIIKNNVVIMSKNTYISLPNSNLASLNIVLTDHPDLFASLEHPFINNEKNILFTNNYNIHNSILNNREKYRQMYPALSSKFKIYFIGCEQICEQYLAQCNVIWILYNKKCFACDDIIEYTLENQFKEIFIEEDEQYKITKYVICP